MNPQEQKFRSLNARMFRTVVVLAVSIGIAAVAFGFQLYNNSVQREFMNEACQIARMTSYVVRQRQNDFQEIKNNILSIYEKADPSDDERLDPAYFAEFDSIKSPEYNELVTALVSTETRYGARCVYIGAYDIEKHRAIYLIDADRDETTYRNPGSFDALGPEDQAEYDAYINGYKPKYSDNIFGTDEVFHAYITNDPEYGHNCTGASTLYKDDRYYIIAYADLDMREAVRANRLFIIQFLVLLLTATFMIAGVINKRIKRLVIEPLQQLTEAANNYSRDRKDDRFSANHFDKLDIRTGDELENLSLTMKDMESDINAYIQDLTNVTAEKERINTELDVARDIQNGMIPHTFPAYPDRSEFALYASMEPAKEVGGDFYDFFLIDEDHLALLIADVTGKGVPAALFMMSSKTLLQMAIMKYPSSPSEVLKKVNEEICESNPADMFVTVWLGILEISSGIMKCANGGHEYPMIRREGGAFELFKDSHGTVLGCFPDSEYPEYEIKLNAGDVIFQYTDGATDTINTKEEFFGTDRLVEALNRNPDNIPQEIITEVKYTLEEYSEGASQFDDLTMICLQYLTQGIRALIQQDELEMEADFDKWDKACNFIEKCLANTECTIRDYHNMLIASEEIFTNICKFAYAPGKGKVTIRVSIYKFPMCVHVTFMDHGIPFDPLKKEDPDVTLSAEERQIGGLGLYLVKKLMDDVVYKYSDNTNILTLVKRLD